MASNPSANEWMNSDNWDFEKPEYVLIRPGTYRATFTDVEKSVNTFTDYKDNKK